MLSCFSSVQFSHSVVSDSFWPHRLQQTRLPCPSPTPRACSNSCPSSPWCHPTISSSVVPFSFCLQSFPISGSFQMSQFFVSGGQNIGVSASAISPSNEYSGLVSFRMNWLDLLAVQGTLKSLLQQFSFMPPWKEKLNLPCERCIPISEAPPLKPRRTHFLPTTGNWVLEASVKTLLLH